VASDGGKADQIMKKLQVVLLALVAMLALSAITAGAASAETTLLAEWLVNGADAPNGTAVETTGKILLVGLVFNAVGFEAECEGSFDGTVSKNGVDEITEVLNAAKVKIGAELVGTALDCTSLVTNALACKSGELAEVWPDNLPWHTLLYLMADGKILDEIQGSPGYHVFCVTTKFENLCTGKTSSLMTNEPTDVKGEFEVASSEEATCNKIGSGMLGGSGLTATISGEPLQVSSV
jgi:hypothetical protein